MSPSDNRQQVFISWSGPRAKAFAGALCPFLTEVVGVDVFYSEELRAFNQWRAQLREALDRSDAMIAVITPESLSSKWMWMEVGAAFTRDIPILPIIIGASSTSLAGPLSEWQVRVIDTKVTEEAIFGILKDLNDKLKVNKTDLRPVFERQFAKEPDIFNTTLALPFPGEDGDSNTIIGQLKRHYPEPTDGLWRLIQSIEGPAYVCDQYYRILIANEAAELLFSLTLTRRHPKPLKDLLTEKATIMENYESVLRNFVKDFVVADDKPIFHAEDIVFKHGRYGRVILRKIGQEYRDAVLPGQCGWVVAFNVIHIDEARAYWNDLQARIQPQNGVSERRKDGTLVTWNRVNNNRERRGEPWDNIRGMRSTHEDFTVAVAENGDKERYCDLCYEWAQKQQWGLKNVDAARKEYSSYQQEFVVVFDSRGEAVTVARIRPGYDMTQHDNLDPSILRYYQENGPDSIADIGAYTILDYGIAVSAFEGMFIHCIRALRRAGIGGVYIQAKRDGQERNVYKRFGFEDAGAPFQSPHWKYEWKPMFLDCEKLLIGALDPNFLRQWRREHRVNLQADVWRELLP